MAVGRKGAGLLPPGRGSWRPLPSLACRGLDRALCPRPGIRHHPLARRHRHTIRQPHHRRGNAVQPRLYVMLRLHRIGQHVPHPGRVIGHHLWAGILQQQRPTGPDHLRQPQALRNGPVGAGGKDPHRHGISPLAAQQLGHRPQLPHRRLRAANGDERHPPGRGQHLIPLLQIGRRKAQPVLKHRLRYLPLPFNVQQGAAIVGRRGRQRLALLMRKIRRQAAQQRDRSQRHLPTRPALHPNPIPQDREIRRIIQVTSYHHLQVRPARVRLQQPIARRIPRQRRRQRRQPRLPVGEQTRIRITITDGVRLRPRRRSAAHHPFPLIRDARLRRLHAQLRIQSHNLLAVFQELRRGNAHRRKLAGITAGRVQGRRHSHLGQRVSRQPR